LQILDNPNIVTCYEVVENEKQMIILMEWLRGGHLLDTLEEMSGQHYSEQQAAILFVQVLGSTLLSCQGELKLSEHCQRARDAQVVIQTTISDAPSIVLLCLYRLFFRSAQSLCAFRPFHRGCPLFIYDIFIYTTVEPGSALCVTWNPASS